MSDAETGNERKNHNGTDLAAKSAFSAWPGAALGFTLSSALEPLEAEAQEAAAPAAAPAEATGTHGMQRRQGRRARRHERRHGRHERRHERRTGEKPEAEPAEARRNNRPSAAERLTAQFEERRMELRDQRVKR